MRETQLIAQNSYKSLKKIKNETENYCDFRIPTRKRERDLSR